MSDDSKPNYAEDPALAHDSTAEHTSPTRLPMSVVPAGDSIGPSRATSILDVLVRVREALTLLAWPAAPTNPGPPVELPPGLIEELRQQAFFPQASHSLFHEHAVRRAREQQARNADSGA